MSAEIDLQDPPTVRAQNEPAYRQLYLAGELHRRAQIALDQLKNCNLCAQYCDIDRTVDQETVRCRTGRHAMLADSPATVSIEQPLGGIAKSGLIRFAGCSLDCQYCKQWQFSQRADAGHEIDANGLAKLMLQKQAEGCVNINLMPASHVVAQILEALVLACERGLRIPLVFNSSGYDSLEALQLLDGVVDIYAAEIKYGNNEQAKIYSCVDNYVEYSHIALREMYRQVGDLIIDEDGIARKGLIVRHLVLPSNQASTKKVLSFISSDISPDTFINLMDGYQPGLQARQFEKLARPVNDDEIRHAIRCGDRCGLHRLDLHLSRPRITI